MLILTRKTGEEIIVDGNIRITITGVRGDQVRIGITAPPDIAVHREEVWQRIRSNEEQELAVAQRRGGP